MTLGQIECPICGRGAPHYHSPEEVEAERFARPVFEKWAEDRIKHIGRAGYGHIPVHWGASIYWKKRNETGRYFEESVEMAWNAFLAGWEKSDAKSRRPKC